MNAPTLIIGLGGKGSDIVLRVAEKVTREQRERIRFAVFDTDVNELREIARRNPFIHTIQTSTRASVGGYLERDTHARDTWFPVNSYLNSKMLTEGAGQVRAVSRLAFETAMRSGKLTPLHNAINELYELDAKNEPQALRVIIVSSLAGGTGSGLILPVAMYVRKYLKTHLQQSSNIIRGFFILPEVFFKVIKGQSEQNNLKSNAYATLKELDAFLMKSDGTLDERYADTVRMELPLEGLEGYEEYDESPYDFCFLFDGQNAEGGGLADFEEYLNHAADCIYAQSIGPMNKRSNSSEDNTMREICRYRGRNRYAGAGTSILKYPVDDVKRYLSLSWANECISKQWMVFDEEFKIRTRENAQKRAQGIPTTDLSMSVCYVDSVDAKAGEHDPFATQIVTQCSYFDEDGNPTDEKKWDTYIDELSKKISTDYSKDSDIELASLAKDLSARIAAIKDGKTRNELEKAVRNAYSALERYMNAIRKRADAKSATIAYEMFRVKEPAYKTDRAAHRLETYLYNGDEFMHPNAVRYFLYNLISELEGEYEKKLKELKDAEEYIDSIADDPATPQKDKNINAVIKNQKQSVFDKLFKKTGGDFTGMKDTLSTCMEKANTFCTLSIYVRILEEAIRYARSLAKAYEEFFNAFAAKAGSIAKEMGKLEDRYVSTKGKAARMVCASAKCLKKMAEEMPYTGGSIALDGALAEGIFDNIRTYAMTDVSARRPGYLAGIFEKTVIPHFERSLLASYSDSVDMDIITAIEREAVYESDDILEADDIEQYVIKVFNEAKFLAVPFIEKPGGIDRSPINACTYNDKLVADADSPRSRLIQAHLRDYGGTPDEDIDKYMIVFYRSFYSLMATDLSKFAPGRKAATVDIPAGEYYEAYYNLINKINPHDDKCRELTPHIDRRWHNIMMMPDLDEENQTRRENQIFEAFFWGLLLEYFNYKHISSERLEYRLNPDKLEDVLEGGDTSLIVPNGTACDQLHEVFDALSIYPELIQAFLKKKEMTRDREVTNGIKLDESSFVTAIKTLKIDELSPEGQTCSIFELPVYFRESTPSKGYSEDVAIRFLNVIIAETIDYVRGFCRDGEIEDAIGAIFAGQYRLLLKNRAAEIRNDNLYERINTRVVSALEKCGLVRIPKELDREFKELKG